MRFSALSIHSCAEDPVVLSHMICSYHEFPYQYVLMFSLYREFSSAKSAGLLFLLVLSFPFLGEVTVCVLTLKLVLQWLNNCVGRKNYITFVCLMAVSLGWVSLEYSFSFFVKLHFQYLFSFLSQLNLLFWVICVWYICPSACC